MIERVLIAVALVALGMGLCRAVMWWQLRRAGDSAPADPLLNGLRPGVPTVLYFTTPTCAPCIFQQRPALEKLQTQLGDSVQVVQVDATEDPDAADRWGVQTVPTTFVLGADGKPSHVNNGVANESQLMKQIEAAA